MFVQKKRTKLTEEEFRLFAKDALLKRVALVGKPFILKGSMLSRQYLENPEMRQVNDLDFLYAGRFESSEEVAKTFAAWMSQVTYLDEKDGVKFDTLSDYSEWENINYAMAEDFPTVNVSVPYKIFDEEGTIIFHSCISIDVSFHLHMTINPVPLIYHSPFIDSFEVPYTVPLSIQIAWKLHQTIVRPRFKDLQDLTFLIAHPSYDEKSLKETLDCLAMECSFDQDMTRENIQNVLTGDLQDLFPRFSKWDQELTAGANAAGMPKEQYYQSFAVLPNLTKINKS